MLGKMIKESLNNKQYQFLGLVITLGLMLFVFVIFLIVAKSIPLGGVKAAIFIALFLCLSLTALIIWSFNTNFLLPVKRLMKPAAILANKDCPAITTSLAELAQGNLAKKLKIESTPVQATQSSDFSELVEVLNKTIVSLTNAAHEFNAVTETPCNRLCYVGADSFLEGQRCGEVMGEALGGRGQVLVSTGRLSAAGLELRRKGFSSALRSKYPRVEIIEVNETREDFNRCFELTCASLDKYPHLAGIYVTEGATPPAVAKAIEQKGKVDKIKIVAHDMTDETMKYVKRGVITATLGQDPFAQGYNPVIHLYNNLTSGWTPNVPRLLTQMDVVTHNNYFQFWEEGRGVIQSQMALDRLAKPINKENENPIKIAVLGQENSIFWNPVREGVLAAGRDLALYHVTVDWIYPEAARLSTEISAETYGPVMEKCLEEGYMGIACIPSDPAMVNYINRAVEKGVPVITFNSEPFSLRSLIYTIRGQASRLMGLSQTLAASSQQASAATSQIKNAMSDMTKGSISQASQMSQTHETLDSLLNNIDMVNREAEKSSAATVHTAQAVNSGTEALGTTLNSIRAIEKSVTETWTIVEELAKHSERIDVVVDMIKDIASRVNVLGLNAAIEATGAGVHGKGFMIVANEIRTLAKNASEATVEVTELISSVKNDITKVEKVMGDGLKKIQLSSTMTDKAGKALNEIKELVDVDQQRLKNIATSINKMQGFSHDVGDSMNNFAMITEQNTKSVESVSEATSEMSQQLSEVAALALSLEQMAQSEQELLAKFILTDEE